MKNIISILCLSSVLFISSCKKGDDVDPCVREFVSLWEGSINSAYPNGSCSSSFNIEIAPGPNGGCQLLFPNLPEYCYSASYQVTGTVSGDSVFIVNEPFGINTISARGRVYLNQLTLQIDYSDGATATLSGTKQ